jgi:hemoglobin
LAADVDTLDAVATEDFHVVGIVPRDRWHRVEVHDPTDLMVVSVRDVGNTWVGAVCSRPEILQCGRSKHGTQKGARGDVRLSNAVRMGRRTRGLRSSDERVLRPGRERRPSLAFLSRGVHADHRQHVAAWWSEVFRGPADYTEQLGGYERMLSKHQGLAITYEQRFRFASLMSLAADDADLPADPEFRSALVAYLEWGTPLAVANSQPGATVVEHAPVPHWGWGEAPPYRP